MGCTKSKPAEREDKTAIIHNVNYDLLKTGDIILFADKKTTANKLTRLFASSQWTHVGVVVSSPGLYTQHDALLFESNQDYGDHLKDISSAVITTGGVRLVDLAARIRSCKSDEIAFCKLEMNTQRWNQETVEIDMQAVISELSQRTYERRPTPLLFSATDLTPLGPEVPDLSSISCGKLVAYTLEQLDVFIQAGSKNEFTPGDFASSKKLSEFLKSGYSYATPKPLKTTTKTKQPVSM